MAEYAALSPSTPAPARWVFQALERIQAGGSVSHDELASHYTPEFLEAFTPEQMLAHYREVAPIAADVATFQPEFLVERGTAIGIVTTLRDGRRYRWEFGLEADRLCMQVLARGPLPAYTDRVIQGPTAEVLVRDYTDVGSVPEHILLLHAFGADVGSWDLVAPYVKDAATVHALDLRGHGRADLRHGYSIQGSLEDTTAATRDLASSDLIVAGHSLGGYVALEYAARTPCRGLITFDGPERLRRNDTEEEIAATSEPLRSVLAEHAKTDYGQLIAGMTTPALFVLIRGTPDRPEPHEAIEQRERLADCAIKYGHTVRWVEADHGFAESQPELTGHIINDFLTTLKASSP
ncbi:alpha/beta hydrolase [Actinopolymorpha sp. B17G11]|uniref:alpha/beta fold hydrolase n=1 Tax=unclassified Actinopolymorpha TaxID=2627063 RepID=UPI0032D964B6